MAAEKQEPARHGGAHAIAAARRHGVTTMFTLSGGHVFPLYDGAVKADPPMRMVDVRHEQTAVFAAEATARLDPGPGAGRGHRRPRRHEHGQRHHHGLVQRLACGRPGGRAPDYRWGSGGLQEIDHPPLLAPVTKRAWTEHQSSGVGAAVDEAFQLATAPHQGPVFLDFAMEALFGDAGQELPGAAPGGRDAVAGASALDPAESRRAPACSPGRARCWCSARDVWQTGADAAARHAADELRLPVIANGQGRGRPPAGHELLVTRARSVAFGAADLVMVVGTPLDFRLGYGEFGGRDGTPRPRWCTWPTVPAARHPLPASPPPRPGDLTASSRGWRRRSHGDPVRRRGQHPGRTPGSRGCRPRPANAIAADQALLTSDADPVHPMRMYGELARCSTTTPW